MAERVEVSGERVVTKWNSMERTMVSGTRPIKPRRTKADIYHLRDSLLRIIARYKPMTVRQVYYQAVSRGLIDKTEPEYKSTVCRLLADMRRNGELPYTWIADNTRWQRKPNTHTGLASLLYDAQRTYRRAIWDEHDVYVEVWLEKEALAGVLLKVTGNWDVPLMVTRGYPSLSYLHSAAECIKNHGKPTFLYYFGDHDPSGVDIPRAVEAGLREMAPDADITFERIAVTVDQIDQYDLITRPTKKTDSRSRGFEGESVEVDAIEPDELRRLANVAIERHINHGVLNRMKNVEEAERETLRQFAEMIGRDE
jgi:hypothetical protein